MQFTANSSTLAQLEVAQWMFNPWLLAGGALAMAAPILIHLLNKRKFRVVDWAAMDFLLDADKKNRRRIRLENLLLLLLRCLAVLLIGGVLARLIVPTELTAGLLDAEQFERIVLLDDSLSMQTRQGNESVWEGARKRVIDLTRALASEGADNTLTVILTSQPDQPVLNGAHLSASTVDDLAATLEELQPHDATANLPAALKALADEISSEKAGVNRIVYIVSDLRERDWQAADTAEESTVAALQRISKLARNCFVVNVADNEDRNLTVVDVKPEGTLVQGVLSRFDVTVANQGSVEARDVRVKFTAGDALPLQAEIERIAAGQTASVPFSFTFTDDDAAAAPESAVVAPRRVTVEVQTARQGEDDRLQADSVALFPARLVRGIPTLIVDGDPSATFGRSESFYLKRSLSPSGPLASGVATEIVTESELESLNLAKYQVIFLCNVYRLGDKTLENLQKIENWTKAGGGLVLMPGDQIDEQFYNENYFRDGEGVSPLKLDSIKGDETETKWVNFKIEQANHQMLKVFEGQNNPFLDNVKTFRWWGSSIKAGQLGNVVSVAAKFNDADDSPAIAEKAFGKGRVLTTTFPADADWSNWTSDPSYLIAMQELVRYVASDRGDRGSLRIGQPLRQSIDLTQYELEASLKGPKDREANLQAAAGELEQATENVWQFSYPDIDQQGFYTLNLNRREGAVEPVLFAANVDPSEGDLKHADLAVLKRSLGDANVTILDVKQAATLASDSSQTELWKYLLWAVGGVLAIEQFLGWLFGRSR